MYRLYGALAVLGVIIAIGIGAFFINTDAADSLSEKLRSAYSFAEAGDMVRSAEKMHEAVNYMDKKSSILCMFVSHKILDDIRQETDKAQVYLGQGQKELFLACCKTAIFRIEDFKSLEFPTISNIL